MLAVCRVARTFSQGASFTATARQRPMRSQHERVVAQAVRTASVQRPAQWVAENKPVNLLVLGPELPSRDEAIVGSLTSVTSVTARGDFSTFSETLSESDWESIEALLLLDMKGAGLEETVKKSKNLRWIHTFTAGVNQLAVPSILDSEIVVTNAKGVYSHSLAEYALFACNYFAKDLPRLLRAKAEKRWDVFEVEELRGRTMGVIGLGDIGMSTARIAKAFEMKIIGVRRRTDLTDDEKQIVDAVYRPEELVKVMGMCDYVVAALPLTENTKDLIDTAAIDAMQPHAVFINIGRGPTVVEPALIKSLQEKRIKGAALDVYYREPLTPESPFYELDNVLMSYHNADLTTHSVSDSLNFYKEVLQEYIEGKELRNIVDVQAGY